MGLGRDNIQWVMCDEASGEQKMIIDGLSHHQGNITFVIVI